MVLIDGFTSQEDSTSLDLCGRCIDALLSSLGVIPGGATSLVHGGRCIYVLMPLLAALPWDTTTSVLVGDASTCR